MDALSEYDEQSKNMDRLLMQFWSRYANVREDSFISGGEVPFVSENEVTSVSESETSFVPARKMRFLRVSWFKYAAAVLIVLLAAVAYLWNSNKPFPASSTEALAKVDKNDVGSGGNKATLTLADGSVVILDSAANGAIAQQGNYQIIKEGEGWNIMWEMAAFILLEERMKKQVLILCVHLVAANISLLYLMERKYGSTLNLP